MKELFIKLYNRFHQLVLYGIIGSFAAIVDFLLFILFSEWIGLYYIFSNCISVLAGITTSFWLNRTYNFKIKDRTAQRFLIFLIVGLCGLCLSNLILWLGIDILHMDEIFTKLASIVLVVGFQFLLNKFVTFRR